MPPQAALFIVSKIAQQAEMEKIALSDIERNMLLFSETSPTLSNIAEVNEVFDRDYNRGDYEKKIGSLIRHVRLAAAQDPDANWAWKQAVDKLRGEDYYLLVMLNESGVDERPRADLIWLIGTALIIVSVIVSVLFFSHASDAARGIFSLRCLRADSNRFAVHRPDYWGGLPEVEEDGGLGNCDPMPVEDPLWPFEF